MRINREVAYPQSILPVILEFGEPFSDQELEDINWEDYYCQIITSFLSGPIEVYIRLYFNMITNTPAFWATDIEYDFTTLDVWKYQNNDVLITMGLCGLGKPNL